MPTKFDSEKYQQTNKTPYNQQRSTEGLQNVQKSSLLNNENSDNLNQNKDKFENSKIDINQLTRTLARSESNLQTSQSKIRKLNEKCADKLYEHKKELEVVKKEAHRNGIEQSSFVTSSANTSMLSNPIENYSRDQELRYTSLSEAPRSISSYSIDSVAANRIGMSEYDIQTVHSTSHRPYDPGSIVNAQTAFERYDPNYPLQRPNMYSSYGQPTLEEINSQQKYLMEQQQLQHQSQQMSNSMMKTEQDEVNSGPIYPRPMYHPYDPTGTLFLSPPGINLSVKITSAQLQYKVSSSSPSPTSTSTTTVTTTNGGTNNVASNNPNAPIIDLSTSNITSSSPNGYNNTSEYSTSGQRITRSPQPGSSPHLASPQVPSPQGQTLDLSVSRLSQRYTHLHFICNLIYLEVYCILPFITQSIRNLHFSKFIIFYFTNFMSCINITNQNFLTPQQ